MRGQCSHVLGLHGPTQLAPEFVGADFDDRVMRDADHGPVGTIQGHSDLGGLPQELIQLFLKRRSRFVHGSASPRGKKGSPKRQVAALYHRTRAFLY